MRKVILTCFAFFAAIIAFSQDKVINDANVEKRSVSGFHAIDVEDGIDLFITQGSEEALAVSANNLKYRDRIKTVVKNGVLRIYFDDEGFNFFRDRRLRAYVSVKSLDEINASGGSDVDIKQGFSGTKLRLSLSGGGDFYGKVTVTNLDVDLSGGSDAQISGTATTLYVEASGGSDFKGYELAADNAKVNVSGGSDAQVTVNKELTADASGGGDVMYRGNGTVRNVSASGGSSVTKRG